MRELCGRLLIGGFHGTVLPEDFAADLARGEVGGAIVFKRNLTDDLDTLASLNAAVARASRAPALVAVDQEGGRVARVGPPAIRLPPMLHLARIGREDLVERAAEVQARELRALGFTLNFAPVLDVHTNPDNPVIGDRAFGTTPAEAARFALAFARGMARGGVLSCGKHFPGHGDTATDSHLELPVVTHDRARLEAIELLPFRQAARAGVPSIMTAHVLYPALDDVPATLSRRIATDLLRGELGYQGVLISDDLEMRAVAARYGYGDAAVRAVEAGCDALLVCSDARARHEALDALAARAGGDAAFRARCEEAHARVTRLATSCAAAPLGGSALAAAFGTPDAREVERAVAEALR